MKQSDRVVKVGDYYELQSIQDIITHKTSKKQEIQSSVSIPQVSDNILTELPTQKQAITKLFYTPSPFQQVHDMTLNQCESSLEALLKQPITDDERHQIEKLLKQIAQVKNNGELPLNEVPSSVYEKKQASKKEAPLQITLKSDNLNIEQLDKSIQDLQSLKFLEISRLENLVGILLGDVRSEPSQPPQQIDEKTKQEIDGLYNSMHSLKCVHDLSGIIHRISANETKFIQISNWVQQLQKTLNLNKQILEEFQNDQMVLNQLEENFNANIAQVKAIVKKLSE